MAVDAEILPSWTFRAWQEIRRAALYATIIGGALVGVLKWYVETFPPQQAVTTEEMDARFTELHDQNTILQGTLTAYQDSLARLRTAVDSTFVRPMLVAMTDVQRRVGRLESGGVETRTAVEQTRRAAQSATIELIAQMNRQSSEEERSKADAENLLREVLQELKSVRSDNEHIKKKLKIDTKTF